MMMKTVVLDDDPTGTQSASDVVVLLEWDAESLATALRADDAVYLQTNSRALSEADAVALSERIRGELAEVSAAIDARIQVVLRGDSTLRGHVFPESDVFAAAAAPILFVPAFPDGGRVTLDTVHYVTVDGVRVPAGETEYAQDPVFGFTSSNLVGYAREKGDRRGVPVALGAIRASDGSAVTAAILNARPGDVIVPDVETQADIDAIARAVHETTDAGGTVIVRCGAPLAAALAGKTSSSLLERPLRDLEPPVLVVCGSHTQGATRQLAALTDATGWTPSVIDTDAAFVNAKEEGRRAAAVALEQLQTTGGAIVSSARIRRAEDDTLAHGAAVMDALIEATHILAEHVDGVITKGGITSADIARYGLGAESARVRGQVVTGVSVWELRNELRPKLLVVVPGNVGDTNVIVDVLPVAARSAHQEARP